MPSPTQVRPIGESFDDPDVVAAYAHRTPYPPALYDRLEALAGERRALLDLGCGPGKIAAELSPRFGRVDAVDLSPAMIEAARAAHPAANIHWTVSPAETAPLEGPYDLATAGASLHWMDHAVVMPRLARALAPGAVLAIVGGDGASPDAPWHDAFMTLVIGWVERLGGVWNSPDVVARNTGHIAWLDQQGQESFSFEHRQTLDSLIRMEHSRATWTQARMGPLAAEFDADLRTLLSPFAVNGMLSFPVRSTLAWGRPRMTARP
jgi:SAM-dependent methyltransferase